MECTKCHKTIPDNSTVCPHCHKVISVECPNCHSHSKNSICDKCGYLILEKCAKCGRISPTQNDVCKCGYPIKSSIAMNQCETDEFACITVSFGALKSIRSLLASKELYEKFLIKLKNVMASQLKNHDGYTVIYGNTYVINFNKELSFTTSADKALRFSLKILNTFSGLNLKLQEELGTPLRINLTIIKKKAEDLLNNSSIDNNVKPLTFKKSEKKYLKGMQIIIDQYTQDCISKDYKTDSLYMLEHDGSSVMFYELLLENYVVPPSTNEDGPIEIKKQEFLPKKNQFSDIYNFKVFDINAKCNFEQICSDSLISKLNTEDKIIALRGEKELQIKTSELIDFYNNNGFKTIYVSCNDTLNYKPWGFFEKIFKEYYGLSIANGLISPDEDFGQFNSIRDFITGKNSFSVNSSGEDARFRYFDLFVKFLRSLNKCVIITDGFENLDDTSIQTLELYFEKYKQINTNFVFITDIGTSVHSKIKSLLRTPLYKEYKLIKNDIASLLSNIKENAEDFVKSFYYEKINEHFNGSKLYFEYALKYLADKDVLINFENKLIIKNNLSILIPADFQKLIKAKLKLFGKIPDSSMILAYSVFLGERLDFEVLEMLGIKNIKENAKILSLSGFCFTNESSIFINNYSLLSKIIKSSLKKDVEEFLVKNIIAKLGKLIDNTTLFSLMDSLNQYKEEYMVLWKNAQLAISVGDYDAYLKNSLGFLSIIDKIDSNISQEDIDENKKEVFQNILLSLYNYSPSKIYSIENILLMDAIKKNDNEKIVKLSNLMLQGALISSNYTDALSLLHNILERMESPSLLVNGAINTKFLLLSLVHIEILFNIGSYRNCIEIGEQLLQVLKIDILEKIKPVNFSTNLFITHLLDTFKLVGFAKLITLDNNLDEFFEKIKNVFQEDLPEKNCIIAVKDFLAGKNYIPSNIENATPFSKTVYLILQELSRTDTDYKAFAQNIYQAKLLALDINQRMLEYICDILIAYAYAKIGIISKAYNIFNDVKEISSNSAIYPLYALTNYLIAKTNLSSNEIEDALIIVNEALDEIQKHNNQAKVFYALFEQLFIDIIEKDNIENIDLESEKNKLLSVVKNNELKRIIRNKENNSADINDFISEEEKYNTDVETLPLVPKEE